MEPTKTSRGLRGVGWIPLLLGLLLIATLLGPTPGHSLDAARGRALVQQVAGQVPVQAPEPVETWWNEEWARFVGIQGSWEIRTSEGRTVMRPEGQYCRFDVLARLTGRLHSYEFDEDGEIVLMHGWIIVSPDRRCSLSGSVVGTEAELQAIDGLNGSESMQPFVESFELRGASEWSLYSPSYPSLLFLLACPLSDSEPRNSIVVNLTWGEVSHVPEEPGRVLTLGLRQSGEPGTPYFHTVVEALSAR